LFIGIHSEIEYKSAGFMVLEKGQEKRELKSPPSGSNGFLTDFRHFLLDRPPVKTLIRFRTTEERNDYNNRIMQRIGLKVDKYSILNIHKIGIEAPPGYVFNELLRWNGDSTCWPNYIAKVVRIDEDLGKVKINLFGLDHYPFGFKKSFFGLKFIPLFKLNSIRIKSTPDNFDFDNARYILYKCSGGYPIGIFTMYVRSSIADLGETEEAQLFFIVGFNFYGKEGIANVKIINKTWESVHNRVTSNVLNRLKQLSEWRLEKIKGNC
jgi:hypothetical protein